MSDVGKRQKNEDKMPVEELPMPPVKLQPQDSSGGVVFSTPVKSEPRLVPQLSNLKLNLQFS
jgi:hypothetical protein